MAVSTWPDICHLSVSRAELVNVLRQMGQQVKWPQKMKAPDSFRNPGFWCNFHRDHGDKTEDCVALKIKVNELLRKGHLREFFSEKAKSHLSKETMGKPTEAACLATATGPSVRCHFGRFGNQRHKPCSCEEKHLECQPRPRGSQAKTPASRNRRDKLHSQGAGESSHSASRRPGYFTHCSELPGKMDTGFSGEVKQTAGEVTLPVYAEGINMSTKFLVVL
ncbi:hypothetical protein F2Q69_00047188 [Brassica cretica]|uniref:Uncharacterized protein n=1 Tax=Brassica cretica TaxID=69181 RepID=A0A8S9PD15_BRACR|nr:hypothetical protein F2Q69_00047188 [Brassica cretica]